MVKRNRRCKSESRVNLLLKPHLRHFLPTKTQHMQQVWALLIRDRRKQIQSQTEKIITWLENVFYRKVLF